MASVQVAITLSSTAPTSFSDGVTFGSGSVSGPGAGVGDVGEVVFGVGVTDFGEVAFTSVAGGLPAGSNSGGICLLAAGLSAFSTSNSPIIHTMRTTLRSGRTTSAACTAGDRRAGLAAGSTLDSIGSGAGST